MPESERIELPVIQPLFYGTTGATKSILVPPSSYAVGGFFIAPEREKYQMVDEWLEYYNDKQRQGDPVADKYSDFLLSTPRQIAELVKDKIRKEKGTIKLWRADDVVSDGMLVARGTLKGRIQSRRSGRGKKVLKNWYVSVNSPYDNQTYGADYNNVECQDELYLKVREKWAGEGETADMICVHMGAFLQRLYKEQSPGFEGKKIIDFDKPLREPYLPYLLDNIGMVNAIVDHYLLGNTYYRIDRALLDDPEIYDPLYLRAIENGNVVFESIHRSLTKKMKPTKRITKAEEGAIKAIKSVIEQDLKNTGFKRIGMTALELKNTEYETLCKTFAKQDDYGQTKYVRLVIPDPSKMPPLIIYKEADENDPVDVFSSDEIGHPFEKLYAEQTTLDDRNRRKTKTKIGIPHSPLLIPELSELPRRRIIANFSEQYRKLIENHYEGEPGEKKELLSELGLNK